MAGMKVSLPGLLGGVKAAIGNRDPYAYGFALEELQRHLEELVGGQHTIAEFGAFYSIRPRRAVWAEVPPPVRTAQGWQWPRGPAGWR